MRVIAPELEAVAAAGAPMREAEPLPITVLIPVFNRADALGRALESVAAQRRLPAEVIVVDDGSTDGSGELAARRGVRVVLHETNRGQVAARNTGIRASQQPWIAFLDSDDEWLPGHLDELWKLREGVVFAASSSINCRGDTRHDRVVGPLTHAPLVLREPWRLCHPQNFVTMSTAMVSRQALLDLGGFQGHDGIVEDLDLWVRLLERGAAQLSPRVSVVYHVHGVQITEDLPRTRAAHLSLMSAHRRADWPCSLLARHRGAQQWDELRDAIAAREAHAAVRAGLGIIRSPTRTRGALELLVWRVRARRASARVHRDGAPTVAIMVTASRRQDVPATLAVREREDLRGRRALGVSLRLVRRPAGVAVTCTRLASLAARALHISVVPASSEQDRSGSRG